MNSESDKTQELDEDGNAVPWVMREPKEADEVQDSKLGLILLGLLFVALWYFTSTKLVVAIVGLLIAIFLHELGHFMTARWTGMKATQFFLFMGPRIWSFRKGETEYGIRSLPLGAFVRIVGMSNLDPPEDDDEVERAYMNKSYPRRMLVITAGSIMHFIQALVIFFVLFTVVGISQPVTAAGWSVKDTGGPAADAGLVAGDKIISIDDAKTTNFEDLQVYVRDNPNKEVDITFERAGIEQVAVATIGSAMVPTEADSSVTERQGRLCLSSTFDKSENVKQGITAAPVAFYRFTGALVSGISEVPSGYSAAVSNIGTRGAVETDEIATNCTGLAVEANRPQSVIGIVQYIGDLESYQEVFLALAAINIVFGIFNLLPLLPLDGGHAAVATYEAIRNSIRKLRGKVGERYQVDFNNLVFVTYAVVILMLLLTAPILVLDIIRPIKG